MIQRRRHSGRVSVSEGIESPRLHLLLYAMLLIFTPFIMLRAFLQDAVGRASASTFSLGGRAVPIVPVVVGGVLVLAYAIFRPRITRRRVIAALSFLGMVAMGQKSTDIYFGHNFYELQQNWHYLAYGIFAFMVDRDLRPRGLSPSRVFLITFALAVSCSTFDEFFQMFISSRVFDISDIAKDTWGTLAGMLVLLLGRKRSGAPAKEERSLRHRALRAYLKNPASVWILLAAFGFLFLSVSSVLTERRYWGHALLFTFAGFGGVFLLFHLSQFRAAGRVLAGTGLLAVLALGASCLLHRHDGIVSHRYGFTDYRGVPVPFFDVMILPSGGFRVVDKKHFFNNRDRIYINRQGADILLIGAGYRDQGGKGFPHSNGSRFIYNPFTMDATQVIILSSDEACRRFNLLKAEGKNVLLILHTTC